MKSPKELADIALSVRKRKEKEEREKYKKEQKAKEEKRKNDINNEINNAIPYIEKKILEAAENGQNSFVYIYGEYQEVRGHLMEHFKNYKPKLINVEQVVIGNYDNNETHIGYPSAIQFSW